MTNRFFNPDDQYCDAVALPYIGGGLYFYATGTDTPLNTYSDSTLLIANTNPVVLDEAGRPGSIFLQNLAYKVVLKDVDLNVIWTMDPVYTSDYSTIAQFITYAGDPNGHVAGTAGTGTIPSSVVWDRTNDVLYVATTTGSASTTVWTAVNPTNAANTSIVMPQGYLTLTSGTPIITGDVTAATAVYYTPFKGNLCPLYNGSSFVLFNFTEQTLTLTSSQAASAIYDVWAFSNSGTFTVGTGPAWTTATAGAGARGTGAGTTQLQLINGIYTNAVSMTVRNSSTTYTVAANQGTYLGSIFMDGSAGQVSCYRSWGSSRKWGVWNAYNRESIVLQAGDSTASWTYATATYRASNGASTNSLTVFCGLAEELAGIEFIQTVKSSVANTSTDMFVGIGVNSTTAVSGTIGESLFLSTQTIQIIGSLIAKYIQSPAIGINTFTSLEKGSVTAATQTFFGTQASMLLSARWMG